MRCAIVFYFVVTMFVVVHSLPELCVFRDYFDGTRANCARDDVKRTFDFIPAISQNITFITIKGQPLKQLPYNAFRNLSSQSSIAVLLLQRCQISQVDAGALLNLHSLTEIDLTDNQINQIDSKLFSDTRQLREIHLKYNKIEVVPNGLFENLLLLEEVYLNGNRIRQVEMFSFKNTPSLQLINLGINQIESMNMLFKDKFDNLENLLLYSNPWRCDCELGPIYELLVKINQLDQFRLVCKMPSTLQGRKWSDISRDIFVCPSEDAITNQDSVMSRTEPTTTTEQADTVPVTVYSGTRNQPVDTGTPQPPSSQNWIPYTISVLVLVCLVSVITGVVLLKRRSDRSTNSGNVDSDLPMLGVQSSAGSENQGIGINHG